jgi:hypothetical protein
MNVVEQSLPQLMPAGEEVTVPLPGPVLLTVRLYWITSKSAVTDLVAFMVTVQSPVPVHAPDQPMKVDVPPGVAVRMITVPIVKLPEHTLPQSMPAGEDVTVPLPSPILRTDMFWELPSTVASLARSAKASGPGGDRSGVESRGGRGASLESEA